MACMVLLWFWFWYGCAMVLMVLSSCLTAVSFVLFGLSMVVVGFWQVLHSLNMVLAWF